MECHVHVDETKHQYDIISEGDCEAIFKWWETITTISPI